MYYQDQRAAADGTDRRAAFCVFGWERAGIKPGEATLGNIAGTLLERLMTLEISETVESIYR